MPRNRGHGLDRGVREKRGRWQVSVAANGQRTSRTFDNPVLAYACAVEVRQSQIVDRPRGQNRLPMLSYLRADPCSYCGERGPTVAFDHIEPVASGGGSTFENLTACCARCNSQKADTPLLLHLARRNGCYEWRQMGTQMYDRRLGWGPRGASRSY